MSHVEHSYNPAPPERPQLDVNALKNLCEKYSLHEEAFREIFVRIGKLLDEEGNHRLNDEELRKSFRLVLVYLDNIFKDASFTVSNVSNLTLEIGQIKGISRTMEKTQEIKIVLTNLLRLLESILNSNYDYEIINRNKT